MSSFRHPRQAPPAPGEDKPLAQLPHGMIGDSDFGVAGLTPSG
jgi:hypothetical protein